MDKKNIYFKYMCNINNIKAIKYDSSNNINSDSSGDSYRSSDIKWEVYQPSMGELNNIYHSLINNLNNDQVNDIIDNSLEFYSDSIISNLINNPQPVVTFDLRTGKNLQEIYAAGLEYLWGVSYSNVIIKGKYLNTYKAKIMPNKV